MHGSYVLVFPFLDGVREQAGLLVGVRRVVVFFLESVQGFMAGNGLRGGMVGHCGIPFELSDYIALSKCVGEVLCTNAATQQFVLYPCQEKFRKPVGCVFCSNEGVFGKLSCSGHCFANVIFSRAEVVIVALRHHEMSSTGDPSRGEI
jgi:hypothetical protein